MENGNIRAYKTSDAHCGNVSEMQVTHPDNESLAVTSTHAPKTYNKDGVAYRIRKLTPREVFRLMDVDDADIDKLLNHKITTTLKNGAVREKEIPRTQLYKMAGNSIVVSCLFHLFRTMLIPNQPEQMDKADDGTILPPTLF